MPHITLPTGTSMHYQFYAGGQPINDIDDRRRPVAVLIHACLSDSTQYRKQIQDPRFGHYTFVTMDSKFHGKSTGQLKNGFSYRDGATDIASAMDMLRIPAAHFVGESYGARRIVHLAVDRPDLVLSMMLISPGVFGEEPDEHQIPIRELRDLMMETNRRCMSGMVPASECHFPRDVSMGYVQYHFGDTLDSDTLEEEIDRFDRQFSRVRPEVTEELLNAYLAKKPIAGLHTVKCPVLLLRGSKNTTEDPSIACELWKEAFCNSTNLEFHMIHGAPLRATAALPFLVTRVSDIVKTFAALR
ncbi:hypothetical protein EMMF5_004970 [Cystobasidiomycetes sp. EMM_F5]